LLEDLSTLKPIERTLCLMEHMSTADAEAVAEFALEAYERQRDSGN